MSTVDKPDLDEARRRLLERRLRTVASPRPAAMIERRPATGPMPLSVSQSQLWFHMQVNPQSCAYNEIVTVRKAGRFDVDAFRRAFNELVRRYEAWRTAFVVVDEEPRQVVLEPPTYDLPLVDLSHLSLTDAEEEAGRLAAEDTRTPYDLTAGHLLRPRLVRLSTDDHRLYLGLHHLVFDGVTLTRIMLPELVTAYDAFTAGQPSPLTEPPVQYTDYATWEREWVEGPEVAGRVQRWRTRLDGITGLDLPLDHPRPALPHFAGGMLPLQVDRATTDKLRAIGHQRGASLFQVIAALYGWWLHRYTGQDIVPFATMSDLRQRSELATLVGYCLSPIVLRAQVGGDPTFGDLVERMRTEALDAMADAVPFEHLVRELGVPRDPRRNPLFQATLVLEPPMVTPDPEWSVHLMEATIGDAVGQSKFELGVEFDERPDGHIAGRFVYATDLFEPGTARQMADHLLALVGAAADRPDVPLAELDRAEVLDPGHHPGPVEPVPAGAVGRCVHELVLEQADRTPDAVAVVTGDSRLTYAELVAQARIVSRRLSAAGAGPGTVVATCLDRGPALVVGLLGVLMAGAAYLPLDPRHPRARSAFLVADAKATVLLTRAGLRSALTVADLPVVAVDDAGPEPAEVVVRAASPDDLAYVMYTSGSTGRPKGVLVEHRNAANLVATLLPRIGIRAGDAVLTVASYTFDMSVGDIFGALSLGARLVVATDEQVSDPAALIHLLTEHDARLLSATPATWSLVMEAGWSGAAGLTASSGGEALTEALADALVQRAGRVWNCYGPTEATDVVSCGPVEPGRAITIGRPLPGTCIYIVDERGHLVPRGVPGEIVIGGVGVARGYLDRPEETARHFADDPFRPGGRIYRTGDRGRWLTDGRLRHLGRYDDQVKIRGYRIEPGEIEAVLREHPEVEAAAVVSRQRGDAEHELVGYVGGAVTDEVALRGWLRARLPDYLVPTAIVTMPRLPLTPGGKVDRSALPARVGPAAVPVPRVGAQTPAEQQILGLWSELLGREVTDVHADFFDLGGYSLLAARMILETRRRLGVDVSLADFLARGTSVAGWAACVDAAGSTAGRPGAAEAAGSARPVFFVYPDLGSAVSVRHFTEAWGPAQPVVPLVAAQQYGRFDRSGGVEGLAAPMVAAIRAQQPQGPYLLAGFSFGGLIAYDIARSLIESGEQVAWLGLMDALSPVAARQMPETEPWAVRIARHLRRSPREQATKYLKLLRRPLVAAGLPAMRTAEDDDFDYRGALVLGSNYPRPPLDLPIEIFATDEAVDESHSETLGWQEFHHGALQVHRFGGGHSTLLDVPDIRRLADLVLAGLRATVTR